MNDLVVDIALVFLFVLIGGVFAASEIALVSLRESQVRSLAERSRAGAKVAELTANSNRFLSAVQIGQGVEIISGAGPLTNNALLIIIAVLSVGFIVSAVSGVARGIRYLSNINITLTLALIAFVFIFGPTLFLLNLIPSGIATNPPAFART